jgi:hypothetical protein
MKGNGRKQMHLIPGSRKLCKSRILPFPLVQPPTCRTCIGTDRPIHWPAARTMNILSNASRPLPFYICSGKHDDGQTYFITFDDNVGIMARPSAMLLRLYQPSCEKGDGNLQVYCYPTGRCYFATVITSSLFPLIKQLEKEGLRPI